MKFRQKFVTFQQESRRKLQNVGGSLRKLRKITNMCNENLLNFLGRRGGVSNFGIRAVFQWRLFVLCVVCSVFSRLGFQFFRWSSFSFVFHVGSTRWFFQRFFPLRLQKGAKECKSDRSRQELSNEYLVAKFGFDTAENESASPPPRTVK